MLTDTVLNTPVGYIIVDAKYYSATSATTVPGWPDIAKQMFYEMALRSVIGEEACIRNYFVFPAPSLDATRYSRIEVRAKADDATVAAFPQVECHYMPIDDVMSAYVERRRNLKIS
jgi:hypothetical protein